MNRMLISAVALLAILLSASSPLPAMGTDQPTDSSHVDAQANGVEKNVAPLDVAYRFDAEGLLSLDDAAALPVPRGSVSAHWHEVGGWAVVVFEGLDLADTGPLCLGVSAVDSTTGLVGQVAFAPTEPGACDDAGAGALSLAAADIGVRHCLDTVAFATRIAAESSGPLVANVLAFPGDGTGIGVSGRLEAPGSLLELDRSFVDCGPLPADRVPVPATPVPEPTPAVTPAPSNPGSIPAAERAPAPSLSPAAGCVDAAADGLQEVLSSPAGPYLVKHPSVPDPATATIVFLPGGGGSYGAAQRVWETIFARGEGFEAFRVVIPYSVDGDLMGEAMRTFDILDEVLWCYGGDPASVHLGGTSNGGLAAFGLMTRSPERFATLLGAPGAFPVQDASTVDPQVWLDFLGGRAVFNGVGAFDVDWRPEVIATHNALAGAGIESVFEEFPGQGHVPGPRFASQQLLRFWESHP